MHGIRQAGPGACDPPELLRLFSAPYRLSEEMRVRMDIRMLRNFIEIVECGSMTAAAKKVYVAQPALSSQLMALEKELGTRLLNRGPHHQELTDAGSILYERAKHIVSLDNSLRSEIKDYEQGIRGTLRLGLTLSTALNMLDGCLTEFVRLHPEFHYELTEAESFEVIELLEHGLVDVGLVRTPCGLPETMQIDFIAGERMAAVYHEDYFELGETGRSDGLVSCRVLSGLPLCVIRRYEQMLRENAANCGFTPNIILSNIQLAVCLVWAQYGLGVAVVPLSSCGFVTDPHLKYRILAEEAFNTRRAIVTRKDDNISMPASEFLRFCKEWFQQTK